MLSHARRQLGDGSEAAIRTAISRAYYAAFHDLRAIAEERVGLPGFGTAADHRDLEVALAALDGEIARTFRRLRQSRNDADYDLDRRVTAFMARLAVESASTLLDYS